MEASSKVVGSAVALLAAISVSAAPATAGAARPTVLGAVTQTARAGQVAGRMTPPGKLAFPLDPEPRCSMLHNFGDPRSDGRFHEGEDIMGVLGQSVYAAVTGVLSSQTLAGSSSGSLSGNAWRVRVDGGTSYYLYAHLSGFAPGLSVGSPVVRGQLIGFVGDTGNAGAGNYHLHFEVHPGGGAPVDPVPLLLIPSGCTLAP